MGGSSFLVLGSSSLILSWCQGSLPLCVAFLMSGLCWSLIPGLDEALQKEKECVSNYGEQGRQGWFKATGLYKKNLSKTGARLIYQT